MARRKDNYTPKAPTTSISARVKLTLKVGEHYVSVEGTEERSVPNTDTVNVGKEWEHLWDDIYTTCDEEIALIVDDMKGNRKRK
jgi:hypothetical protein